MALEGVGVCVVGEEGEEVGFQEGGGGGGGGEVAVGQGGAEVEV